MLPRQGMAQFTSSQALRQYARKLHDGAITTEMQAERLARTALTFEREGQSCRAEMLWHTCRTMRVQALLDRARSVAAEIAALMVRRKT